MQYKRWLAFGVFAVLALIVVPLRVNAAPYAAQNLITNPGFEEPFVTTDTKTSVGQGWSPWWLPRPAGAPDWSYHQPDFIPSQPCGNVCDHRIHSGGNAQRIFQYFGSYVAGLYQQVNVPQGADLQLTAFGQSWSSQTEQPQNVSNNGTKMHLRIGIDPLGGTNPLDPRVVWSGEQDALDSWQQFQVFARSQGTQVTVFMYAAPDDARRKNEVYWDDVSLQVLSGNLAATAQATYPTATPVPVVVPPTPISVALGQNLLSDGSFEGPLYIPCSRYDTLPWRQIPCEGLNFDERVTGSRQRVNIMWNTVMVPRAWKAWWLPPNTNHGDPNFYQNHPNNCYADAPEGCAAWHNPEFRDTKGIVGGPSRIHSGQNSVKYFTFWSVHEAGVMQTVAVPAGSIVRFSAWMQAWSSNQDMRLELPDTYLSSGQTNMHMKVGIDPCGGDDPWNSNIVWSPEHDAYDTYSYYEVRATAQCDKVTVFTHSMPEKAMKHNDMYVDDAELVVIDSAGVAVPAPAAPANPAPQTSASVVNAAPPPTALPRPDGAIVHVVKAGDTIFGLSLQYQVPMDQILQLNGLTKDSFIHVGQELVISAPPPTATSAPEDTAQVPTLTPTPAQIAQNMKEMTGQTQLCVSAFNDINGDGLFVSGERLVKDTTFTVADGSGSALVSYTSDGVSEPHCFTRLKPGDYIVSIKPADGALPTSDRRWSIPLEQGTTIHLNFGSQPGRAPKSSTGGSSDSGGAIGLLLLALAGGGAGWLIYQRRKSVIG